MKFQILIISLLSSLFQPVLPLIAAPEPTAKFRIGVIQSLTGLAEMEGKSAVQALSFAAEDLNAKEPGTVELLIEDDGTDSHRAASALQKLKLEKVAAVIGSTWPDTTEALIPLAASSKLVLLNTTTAPEVLNLDQGLGFAFNNGTSVVAEMQPLDQFVEKNQVKSIAVLHVNSPWGVAQLQQVIKISEKYQVKIIQAIETEGSDNNDWGAVITRLKAASPEALVLLLNPNDISLVLRRAAEQEFKPRFFGSKNSFTAFEKTTVKNLYQDFCFTFPLERVVVFSARFRKRWKVHPRMYADNTYDALGLLVAALRQVQEKKLELRTALQQVSYSGLAGNYSFSEKTSLSTGSVSLSCFDQGRIKSKRRISG